MIITFEKDILIQAVNIVMRAVSSKSSMSILECILIRAVGSTVIFTANDNETAIETFISEGCDIEEEGVTAVDARLFSDIIRKIDGDEIKLAKEGHVVTISSLESEFKIQERDPDQFPLIPMLSEERKISLSQMTLKKIIQGVIFSIAMNDSNKMMTGGFMEVEKDKMKLTTLDGHRISIMTTPLKKEYPAQKAIIPGKALSEIGKLMEEDAEKEVDIFFDRDYVMFKFGDTTITSRLIDGEYFDVRNMISSDYDIKMTVSRKGFLSKLESAIVMASEADKKPLVLNIEDGSMTLRFNSQKGTHKAHIDIRKTGGDILIGFNPKFLMDPLKAIGTDEVSFYFTNPKAACYIRDDEGEYTYVVLPIYFNPAYY